MIPLRGHLPTRDAPLVNTGLITTNVLAFLWEETAAGHSPAGVSEALIDHWALVPGALLAHPLTHAPTLLTHMFLHGGLLHIAGNMLFLWIFGDNVEDALGHARYLAFYLACGLVAAFTQIAFDPLSRVPMLGASGAIAGVLAAYGLLYPRAPITVLNPIPLLWLFWGLFIYLPAWFIILEFFLLNLWAAFQPASPLGGVAFGAHVGGFIFGGVLLRFLRPNPVPYVPWLRWAGQRARRV